MPISLKRLSCLYHNSGSIFFISLWILVILTIFSIGISSRVSSEMRLVRYLGDGATSLYLAKAAVNREIAELQKDKTPNYDTLYELRKKEDTQLAGGSFSLSMIDEESLININTAPLSTIEHLPGLAPELAKAIVESNLKPFLLKEELLLIEGITPEIFAKFKDLITVYGNGRVNINTASREIFKVLGLEDNLIEIILNYRKGEDGQEATADDRVFKDTGSIINSLREFTILTLDQELKINELLSKNLLGVGTGNLRLNIDTKFSARPTKNYTVILERASGKIKFWQER